MIIKKIMIKNVLKEMIVIMKEYKVIIVIIKNKVIVVQKIIFMIVRERVLLATPGHRDKDWMPPLLINN